MKLNVRTICMIALLTAVTSVLSIMQIPTPWGVPFTLQTAAMALSGYLLGEKYGTVSTILYVLLGTIGVPVFAGMSAGPGVLFGATGGYIFGFIFMTLLCGIGRAHMKKGAAGVVWLVVFSALGLAACHILGIIQLCSKNDLGKCSTCRICSISFKGYCFHDRSLHCCSCHPSGFKINKPV